MKLGRIVTSLLENDLYKFSMGQAIYHQFSDYKTTWSFKCRNKDVHFTKEMVEEIREQIKAYCELRFTEDELSYLDGIKWIKGSYIDFLRLWKPRYEDFTITDDAECGLVIETAGTWLNTSMYEIQTLAIVNEVYFRMQYDYGELLSSFKKRLDNKYTNLRNGHWYCGTFSEFGLRRRLSAEAQELVVEKFSHLNDTAHCASRFIGTSNVFLAKNTELHQLAQWHILNIWEKIERNTIMGKTIAAEKLTNEKFLNLYKVHAETESGDQIGYLVASRAKEVDGLKAINHDDKVDAVAICALTEDDKMVLIRQYRYAIGSYIYELPAGLVDDGESVCDAAIREMHEETGLTLEITDLPIGNKGGYSSAGMTDETCTLVVGKVTGEISDKYKEASEEIEVLLVDKKEAARILKEENVCIRLALMLMMFIHE